MGEYKCVYCQAKKYKIMSYASDIRYNPDDTFPICVCSSCGIMYTAPHLNEKQIIKYYPSNYGQYKGSDEIISIFGEKNNIENISLRRQLSIRIKTSYTNLLYYEVHGTLMKRWIPYILNSCYRLLMNISGRNYHYRDEFPMKAGHSEILYIGSGSPLAFKRIQDNPNIHLTTIDINEEIFYRKDY